MFQTYTKAILRLLYSVFRSICFGVCMLIILPIPAAADSYTNFTSLEIARAYLQQNPYIIVDYSLYQGDISYVGKVERVYMEADVLTVSGPVILKWKKNSSGQRVYIMPDSAEVFLDELSGNYHYGYYKPLRAALKLQDMLTPAGGDYSRYSSFLFFPPPEALPNIDKSYAAWKDELPPAIHNYCNWWNSNASIGPPALHQLIDSVVSIPEGGYKVPPSQYVMYNQCPGEGCTYGTWKTSEAITLYKKPASTERIGEIAAGESFTAHTGNVYLMPLKHIVSEPFYVYDTAGQILLEPGRSIYVLSNIGEGHSFVWVNGRIMETSQVEYNPTQVWWVQVSTAKGKKGWIEYPTNGSILGSDMFE